MTPYTLSTRNQVANTNNPYQSDRTKALCVCSAGLLRSPTIAKFLSDRNYNTRACGTSKDYALIPLSSALLHWADEIHVVQEQVHVVTNALTELKLSTPVFVYDIPDMYQTFDPELLSIIEAEYNKLTSS